MARPVSAQSTPGGSSLVFSLSASFISIVCAIYIFDSSPRMNWENWIVFILLWGHPSARYNLRMFLPKSTWGAHGQEFSARTVFDLVRQAAYHTSFLFPSNARFNHPGRDWTRVGRWKQLFEVSGNIGLRLKLRFRKPLEWKKESGSKLCVHLA